jgi:hypothetical protein
VLLRWQLVHGEGFRRTGSVVPGAEEVSRIREKELLENEGRSGLFQYLRDVLEDPEKQGPSDWPRAPKGASAA